MGVDEQVESVVAQTGRNSLVSIISGETLTVDVDDSVAPRHTKVKDPGWSVNRSFDRVEENDNETSDRLVNA